MLCKLALPTLSVLLLSAAVMTWLGAAPPSSQPASPDAPHAALSSFGVVGDGVADDTEAIQRAIDSGLGDVTFPKGVYRLTRPVVIDLDKVGYTSLRGNGVARIEMHGAGPAFRFVGTHFRSADPGGYTNDVWERQRMPLVDGMAILGQHDLAVGIAAVGTMQLTITKTHIRHTLHGIQLLENNRNVIVADCHIYENRGVGIYYDNVNLHQSNITNCHISYNDGGGVVSRAGNVRNIHISGCDIESNMAANSPPTANVLIDCRGSRYGTGEVAITGCTIQHNNPSPDSANIRIIGRSDSDPDAQPVREGNVTISGNVLSDVQVNVHLQDCRGVAIVGNTFWQGYTHDMLIEGCSSVIVGPNNFDRNPRYAYGNTKDANNGIVFRQSTDCTLTGLHITNVWRKPAGLVIEDCMRFNITNCTILDCDNAGLLMKNVSASRLSDCLIRDDRPDTESMALRIVGGTENQIIDNHLDTPVLSD